MCEVIASVYHLDVLLSNEVRSNYCKRVSLFHAIFSLDIFCAFLEHSLTSQVTCSLFPSSFLNDLYCSYSEVEIVAKRKSIAACDKKCLIAEWAVLLVRDRAIHGSNPGVVNNFCTHNEKFFCLTFSNHISKLDLPEFFVP